MSTYEMSSVRSKRSIPRGVLVGSKHPSPMSDPVTSRDGLLSCSGILVVQESLRARELTVSSYSAMASPLALDLRSAITWRPCASWCGGRGAQASLDRWGVETRASPLMRLAPSCRAIHIHLHVE
jgi:hypothetical protein